MIGSRLRRPDPRALPRQVFMDDIRVLVVFAGGYGGRKGHDQEHEKGQDIARRGVPNRRAHGFPSDKRYKMIHRSLQILLLRLD